MHDLNDHLEHDDQLRLHVGLRRGLGLAQGGDAGQDGAGVAQHLVHDAGRGLLGVVPDRHRGLVGVDGEEQGVGRPKRFSAKKK